MPGLSTVLPLLRLRLQWSSSAGTQTDTVVHVFLIQRCWFCGNIADEGPEISPFGEWVYFCAKHGPLGCARIEAKARDEGDK